MVNEIKTAIPNKEIPLEGIELDLNNPEFNYALDFVLKTNQMLYLTGKAGTGKTTFLKTVRQMNKKNMVVLAPTGVAAVNAGGQTIHSFFHIPPSMYVPGDKRLRRYADSKDKDKSTIYDNFRYNNEKKKLLKNLELLVIDEISMVRCDLLDVVDCLLRVFRKNNKPFGGVQVLLIGDAFQLPPVAKPEDWDILGKFYSSPFFFGSKVMESSRYISIELKKIYRQSEQDFIDLLNRVRVNQMAPKDFVQLNNKYNPTFSPDDSEQYIILATTNASVDSYNESKLQALKGQEYTFEACIKGDFPENNYPTDKTLRIKVGSQIMLRKNRLPLYCNGTIGTITKIEDDKITVSSKNRFGESNSFIVERETWENRAYRWNEEQNKVEEEIIGTFTQFPVKLAWSITVHKSQGLTFDRVIADVGFSFAPGQVYVALSRCTSLSGLVLKSKIMSNAIKTDQKVLAFAENNTPDTLITRELQEGKADFLYKEARQLFAAGKFYDGFLSLSKAIKYRNDLESDVFRRYYATL